MPSTTKRGNYYKKKTQKWYEDRGYTVELCEFVYSIPISKTKHIYKKRDILASDGIAYNDEEFILWNSKHTVTGDISSEKHRAKKKYLEINVPNFIKKQVVIWEPRKQPHIFEL